MNGITRGDNGVSPSEAPSQLPEADLEFVDSFVFSEFGHIYG
jgi:hypothetical protein